MHAMTPGLTSGDGYWRTSQEKETMATGSSVKRGDSHRVGVAAGDRKLKRCAEWV